MTVCHLDDALNLVTCYSSLSLSLYLSPPPHSWLKTKTCSSSSSCLIFYSHLLLYINCPFYSMASRMKMNFSFQTKAKALKQAHINDLIIRDLMKLPDNRKCINCNTLAPQYVCTTFSTFVCLTCSGIHREFTHRVKSVSMANFTPEEVAALQAGGNQRAKKAYLSRWNSQQRSTPDGSDVQSLRDFIKHTYIERRYADNTKNCHNSPRVPKIDDGSVNSSSYSFDDRSSGFGEEPLRNSINRRNDILYEAANVKLLHDKHHVKNTNDGLSTAEEAQIEQKLSRHLEELDSISRRLRNTIQPFESSDSPHVYSCEASRLQETVFSIRSGSDTISPTANIKDVVGVIAESKAELEPHIYRCVPTSQLSPSTGETSFSNKFQAVVLRMMEHKRDSARGSEPGPESSIPNGVQALQTCQSIGEQRMTSSDNWALLDPPVQGKMCTSLNYVNLESYSSVSTNQGMNDPSNSQLSSISGSAPDLRHDMLHLVPYQVPTSSKKELTKSEALFAATFSSFSWSSSSESGEIIPHEKQSSPQPLKSRNPFDVSNDPTNFQGTMPSRDEHTDGSYSTRLLHSSSSLSTSSQFFSPTASPHRVMSSEGLVYAEMPSTCTHTRPPPCSPLLLGPIGNEGDENDGYWHKNYSFHHRLPARSKSFSFRGNPFA